MAHLAEDIYANLGPFADDDVSGELRDFLAALVGPLEDVADVLSETDDHLPWEMALDVDQAPASALPWLAQWVGVRLDEADSEAVRRDRIRTPDGFARGTRASIAAAARRTLTGTRRVVIRERTPDAYNLYIRTAANETPNPAATEAAIVGQKPAGIVLDYEAVTAMSYIDLDADHADYDAVAIAFSDYDQISETTP